LNSPIILENAIEEFKIVNYNIKRNDA